MVVNPDYNDKICPNGTIANYFGLKKGEPEIIEKIKEYQSTERLTKGLYSSRRDHEIGKQELAK